MPEPVAHPPPPRRWIRPLLIALILGAACGLRLIHLSADTPLEMAKATEGGSLSVGIFVDEGYKTLSARNLFLYGTAKWHPDDSFPGWMEQSPLTQWAYYLSFHIFGLNLSSARLVTIAWFFVFLLGYVFATARDYSTGLLVAGLLLLGLMHSFFFFSRVALFVVPIAVCVYGLLFLLRRQAIASHPATAMAVGGIAAAATLGIKASSLLYFFPVVLAVGLVWCCGSGGRPRWTTVALGLGVLLVMGMVLWVTRPLWSSQVAHAFSEDSVAPRILLNRLGPSSGCLISAGLLCAAHALLTRSGRILGNAYGASLVALVALGPLLVGVFPYDPLRYYAPLTPAYLLLVLEWFHARAWDVPIPQRASWPTSAGCLALVTLSILGLGQAINEQVLSVLPLGLGPEPGLSGAAMYRYVIPLTIVLAIGSWVMRRRVFHGRTVRALVIVLLALATMRDAYVDGRFFLRPSYRRNEIAAEVRRVVPLGASVGGDWAPLFTMDSDIRTLFMNEDTNNPAHDTIALPDYLLHCDTVDGRTVRRNLQKLDGVRLGPAILRSSYIDRELILYPVSYGN